MLRDRKVLVEEEITRQTEAAAAMYLDIVRGAVTHDIVRGAVTHDAAYAAARDRITELQHERRMIQLLLDQGHE